MEKGVAPVNVSPLIRVSRWTLLVAGVIYGSQRYNILHRQKQRRLEEEERTRPEREAKAKLQREKRAKEEMDDLQNQLGVKI